jgi:hypothetical protein
MKKIVALMVLVAFTFAVQADCGKCGGDKQGADKAKAEGCCPDKSGKCPAGGDKAPDSAKKDGKKA